jgi:hypothetical protein
MTVFIDLVGFGIVIPVLPYYAEVQSLARPQSGRSALRFLFGDAAVFAPVLTSVGMQPAAGLAREPLGTALGF